MMLFWYIYLQLFKPKHTINWICKFQELGNSVSASVTKVATQIERVADAAQSIADSVIQQTNAMSTIAGSYERIARALENFLQ